MNNNNEQAHANISMFHFLCDLYNEHKLEDYAFSKEILKVYQSFAKDALDTIKQLHLLHPCKTTDAYLTFAAKVIIRLSHLRWNDRKETEEERAEHINYIREKYLYKNQQEEKNEKEQ